MMHPPPYLGVTSSRYVASLLSAEGILEYTVTGGTTEKKNSTHVNVISLISQFWGFIWASVYITGLPPPLIHNGHNQYSKSFKDPPTGSH